VLRPVRGQNACAPGARPARQAFWSLAAWLWLFRVYHGELVFAAGRRRVHALFAQGGWVWPSAARDDGFWLVAVQRSGAGRGGFD